MSADNSDGKYTEKQEIVKKVDAKSSFQGTDMKHQGVKTLSVVINFDEVRGSVGTFH